MFELKNGAEIYYLAMKQQPGSPGGYAGYVLARTARTAHYDYVVWTVDGEGNCYNGGYHGQDLYAALAEYRERSPGAR